MSAPNFFTGFLALGTGSASFVELTGSGYGRVAVTFGPIVGTNTNTVTAETFLSTGTWPTVTQFGLYDASGNLDMWWNRTTLVTLAAGATFTIQTGALPLVIPSLVSSQSSTLVQWAALSLIGTAEINSALMTGPYGAQFGGSL